MTSEIFGVWVATGLTLFIMSFVYKDNPFFKLAEHIYVGATVGYELVITIWKTMYPILWKGTMDDHNYWLIIPTILGILILARIIPKIAWLSRISFAFIIGYGAGLTIPVTISTFILKQTENTVKPLVKTAAAAGSSIPASEVVWTTFTALVVFVGVLTALFYFFFSVEHKGATKWIARTGVTFLMIYFGATYGATVMGRFALLYGRFYDLHKYSASKYHYATLVWLAIMVIIFVVLAIKDRGKTSSKH